MAAPMSSATPDLTTVDPATRRFVDLQQKLLRHYHVDASSRLLTLKKPAMRAHVLEAGSGAPIILIHGGDGEAVNWAATMARLQARARVISVDRPGFGLSDAFDYRHVDIRRHASDFIVSIMDALGLSGATVAGSSMGGFFALATALDHPERVHGLVLVGFAVGITRELPLGLRIICGVPGLARMFMRQRPTMEAQRKQYRDMFHMDPDTVLPLYFETRIAGIQLPSERGTWATLLPRVASLRGVRKEMYLGDELPDLRVPSLMIMGDNDMVPAAVGRAAVARIPGGRFEFLPGVGHFAYWEAPGPTADIMARFVQDVSARGVPGAAIPSGHEIGHSAATPVY